MYHVWGAHVAIISVGSCRNVQCDVLITGFFLAVTIDIPIKGQLYCCY